MILQMNDICKDYLQGKMTVPVLRNIDFSMEEGEYVAIMGPSGSGKTTLMNIVGCLDQATSGKFFLDGKDISKCSDNQMSDIRLKKIGFVFQSFQLLPGSRRWITWRFLFVTRVLRKRTERTRGCCAGTRRSGRQDEL